MTKWWKISTSPEWTILILFLIGIEMDIIYNITSDYQQGYVYKIIYIHVPLAWITLQNYVILILMSILYMIRKERIYEIYIKILSVITIICGTLTIITGSLWGKPTWGTYWVFDVRLTSMLILVIILSINMLILTINKSTNIYNITWKDLKQHITISQNKGNIYKWIAIVTIIGGINIPIIKYSVDWWSSLHQKSTISINKISIDYNTGIPIIIGWLILSFIILKLINKNWNNNYKNLLIIKYNTLIKPSGR